MLRETETSPKETVDEQLSKALASVTYEVFKVAADHGREWIHPRGGGG